MRWWVSAATVAAAMGMPWEEARPINALQRRSVLTSAQRWDSTGAVTSAERGICWLRSGVVSPEEDAGAVSDSLAGCRGATDRSGFGGKQTHPDR